MERSVPVLAIRVKPPRVWAGMTGMRVGVGAIIVALFVAAPAEADGWLPHGSDATWTYQWTDSTYNTTPTNE